MASNPEAPLIAEDGSRQHIALTVWKEAPTNLILTVMEESTLLIMLKGGRGVVLQINRLIGVSLSRLVAPNEENDQANTTKEDQTHTNEDSNGGGLGEGEGA